MTAGGSPLTPVWDPAWELLSRRMQNWWQGSSTAQGSIPAPCVWANWNHWHAAAAKSCWQEFHWRGGCLGCCADRFNRNVDVCTELYGLIWWRRGWSEITAVRNKFCLCKAFLLCYFVFQTERKGTESSDIPGEIWQGTGVTKLIYGHSCLHVEHCSVAFTASCCPQSWLIFFLSLLLLSPLFIP